MSKIFNNTTSLNEILEAIQNKAAGGGSSTEEDVTAEVSENTATLAELVSAVDALETLVASKASPEGIDTSDATATANTMLSGYTAYVKGQKITGTIGTKTSSNLTASGATITVPAGYYASNVTKTITSGKATTPATTISVTPSISVDSAGKITASASTSKSITPTITAGYVSSGTAGTVTVSGSNTKQLTTKAATTYTPGTSNQTISSGTYLTGVQTIKGDANLVASNIKNGTSIFGVTGTYTGSGSSEDVTSEVSTYTTKIASLESAVASLEAELANKTSGGSGGVDYYEAVFMIDESPENILVSTEVTLLSPRWDIASNSYEMWDTWFEVSKDTPATYYLPKGAACIFQLEGFMSTRPNYTPQYLTFDTGVLSYDYNSIKIWTPRYDVQQPEDVPNRVVFRLSTLSAEPA